MIEASQPASQPRGCSAESIQGIVCRSITAEHFNTDFLTWIYTGIENLGPDFTKNMNQFTSEGRYHGTIKTKLWGEAQRGNMGKQACYFQVATLAV